MRQNRYYGGNLILISLFHYHQRLLQHAHNSSSHPRLKPKLLSHSFKMSFSGGTVRFRLLSRQPLDEFVHMELNNFPTGEFNFVSPSCYSPRNFSSIGSSIHGTYKDIFGGSYWGTVGKNGCFKLLCSYRSETRIKEKMQDLLERE